MPVSTHARVEFESRQGEARPGGDQAVAQNEHERQRDDSSSLSTPSLPRDAACVRLNGSIFASARLQLRRKSADAGSGVSYGVRAGARGGHVALEDSMRAFIHSLLHSGLRMRKEMPCSVCL